MLGRVSISLGDLRIATPTKNARNIVVTKIYEIHRELAKYFFCD